MRERNRGPREKGRVLSYSVPQVAVWGFYVFLLLWTCVSIGFIWAKGQEGPAGDFLWLGMIAFVLGFTWYFSLGISYRAELAPDGVLNLKSFRRVLLLSPADIKQVEPPFLPWGFMRFKLEREKAYIFCSLTNETLREIIKRILELNPEVKIKSR